MIKNEDIVFFAWPFGNRQSKYDTPLKKERFDALRVYFKRKHHNTSDESTEIFVVREFTKIT